VRSYITSEREFLSEVAAGLAELEAGRVTDHQIVAEAIRRIYHPPA
jgi:predicted transcriptional regulator